MALTNATRLLFIICAIGALAAIGLGVRAYRAQSASAGPSEEFRAQAIATCKGISELATTIMTQRQNGTDMAQMMETAGGNQLAQRIVVAAYDQPRMRVAQNQQVEIQDFANEAYLACLKDTGLAQ